MSDRYPPAIQPLVDRALELYDARCLILNCLDRRPPDQVLAIAAYIRAMDAWPIEPVESTDGARKG